MCELLVLILLFESKHALGQSFGLEELPPHIPVTYERLYLKSTAVISNPVPLATVSLNNFPYLRVT